MKRVLGLLSMVVLAVVGLAVPSVRRYLKIEKM
jgi:hypothetical protein